MSPRIVKRLAESYANKIVTIVVAVLLMCMGCQDGVEKKEIKSKDAPKVVSRDTEKLHDGGLKKTREEKMIEIEQAFTELQAETAWSRETKNRIQGEIDRYLKIKPKAIESYQIECKSDMLCRLVIIYPDRKTASEMQKEMMRGILYEWDGAFHSTSEKDKELREKGIVKQIIYLVDRKYKYDGKSGEFIRRQER